MKLCVLFFATETDGPETNIRMIILDNQNKTTSKQLLGFLPTSSQSIAFYLWKMVPKQFSGLGFLFRIPNGPNNAKIVEFFRQTNLTFFKTIGYSSFIKVSIKDFRLVNGNLRDRKSQTLHNRMIILDGPRQLYPKSPAEVLSNRFQSIVFDF